MAVPATLPPISFGLDWRLDVVDRKIIGREPADVEDGGDARSTRTRTSVWTRTETDETISSRCSRLGTPGSTATNRPPRPERLPTASDVRIVVDGESVELPPPDRVDGDRDASALPFVDDTVGIGLHWNVRDGDIGGADEGVRDGAGDADGSREHDGPERDAVRRTS